MRAGWALAGAAALVLGGGCNGGAAGRTFASSGAGDAGSDAASGPSSGADASGSGGGDAAGPAESGAADGAGEAGCGDTQTDPHDCGACGHDCLGSTCTHGTCDPTVLATGPAGSLLYGIAYADGYVYWLQAETNGPTADVYRCAATGCGSAPTRVVAGVDPAGFSDASIHASQILVQSAGSAASASTGGSAAAATPLTGNPQEFLSLPSGVVSDGANAYWIGWDKKATPPAFDLFSCSIGGCAAPQGLVLAGLPDAQWTGSSTPALGLVVDAQDAYFLMNDADGATHLLRCDKQGCASAPSLAQGVGTGLAVDPTHLYYVASGDGGATQTLEQCPSPDCASSTPLFATASAGGSGLAAIGAFVIDSSGSGTVYGAGVANAGSFSFTNTVWSCPVGGCSGQPAQLAAYAAGHLAPAGVTVDSQRVFWADPLFFAADGGEVPAILWVAK